MWCHEDPQMVKVMQKFQKMGLGSTSSTRPKNLNKPIPVYLKRFELERMLNTNQVIKRYFNISEISTTQKRNARKKGLEGYHALKHFVYI